MRRRREHPQGRRFFPTVLGVLLVWGALGAFGYIVGWQIHAKRAGAALVKAEHTLERRVSARPAHACVVTPTQPGQLAGLLEIPAIRLVAPVEEGTSDAVLAVAVGHDASSVWPGASGTAAFLAHDVSYFVHLSSLRAGDLIEYRTACSTTTFTVSHAQVVNQGAPIPDASAPSIVLDTCYPPNALFFTSQRLVVWATETAGRSHVLSDTRGVQGVRGASATLPLADRVVYSVPAPPALLAQGLTLQQNEAPMGTMTLQGETSPQWEQSPGPLSLETAALEAYFGGLHSAAQRQMSWWAAISEAGVAPPAGLLGATVVASDSPLDVEIVSVHDHPVEVELSTEITLGGGSSPGTYAETVTAVVRGETVLVGSWTLEAK